MEETTAHIERDIEAGIEEEGMGGGYLNSLQ